MTTDQPVTRAEFNALVAAVDRIAELVSLHAEISDGEDEDLKRLMERVFAHRPAAEQPTDPGNDAAVRALREIEALADLSYDQAGALQRSGLADRFYGIVNLCRKAIARVEAEGRQS